MSFLFSRSPLSKKIDSSIKISQNELNSRKFQQCVNSEQDFVRNVGFFLEKLKSTEIEVLFKTVDRIKTTIKASKTSETERFLALLLLKTLMECEEKMEIARYSANKLLKRLRILAEKGFLSNEKKGFSPFFFRKSLNKANNNKAFLQLLLECLKFWGFKYKPHLLEKALSLYRKTYQELVKKGVIFPESYRFFWRESPSFSQRNIISKNQGTIGKIEVKNEEINREMLENERNQRENMEKIEKIEENKEISIENKRKISRPLINVMKTSESPEKKNRKKPEILIKSRSFNDLLEENREIPMKTPEKLNTLKKPKIMALKSLNLSDFLSKISSDSESPLQTPIETKESNKDSGSFRDIADEEMNKMVRKTPFSRKIEGFLNRNEAEVKKNQEKQEKIKENKEKQEKIEENKEKLEKIEEKLDKIEENQEKQDNIEENQEKTEKIEEKQKKIQEKQEKSEEKHEKQEKMQETPNKNKDDFKKIENIHYLSQIPTKPPEIESFLLEISNLKAKVQILSNENEDLTFELSTLRGDFQEISRFSQYLQSELDKSRLKNADLALNLESLRRENQTFHENKRKIDKNQDFIEKLQMENTKIMKKYDELQFDYENLINEKMALEISRKRLKSEKMRLLEELELFKANLPKPQRPEIKVSNDHGKKLKSPEKKLSFESFQEEKEPNFDIHKSFDFRLRKKQRKLEKSLSFYEKNLNKSLEFKYIEDKNLDSDILRIEKLIKTDKFLKNEEIFRRFCLISQGEVLENEQLSISFLYKTEKNGEKRLEIMFKNKTALEIVSFQSKVLNPRSKIQYLEDFLIKRPFLLDCFMNPMNPSLKPFESITQSFILKENNMEFLILVLEIRFLYFFLIKLIKFY